MADDHQLLLFIAAKVARLDAVTNSIHSILFKDLEPNDKKLLEKRRWAIQRLYNNNIAAERNHLKTQFPDDYKVLDEYITLGERENMDSDMQAILDILQGRVDLPDAFRESPNREDQDDDPKEPA